MKASNFLLILLVLAVILIIVGVAKASAPKPVKNKTKKIDPETIILFGRDNRPLRLRECPWPKKPAPLKSQNLVRA